MPELKLKPIRSLSCTCCGQGTRGRQWWNQDTGYGLCPDCGDYIAAGKHLGKFFTDEEHQKEMEHTYGKRGVYWDVKEEQ